MHGNMEELCWDNMLPTFEKDAAVNPVMEYTGTRAVTGKNAYGYDLESVWGGAMRVVRGGGYTRGEGQVRSASRALVYEKSWSGPVGIRVVRSAVSGGKDASFTIAPKPPAPVPTVNASYKIGDTGPAGGTIFYDKGSFSDGWRYLEAAPSYAGFNREMWGYYGKSVKNTKLTVGSGKQNTQAVFDAVGKLEMSDAPELTLRLTVNGFKDWFLPSQQELVLMYKNLAAKGLGDFAADWYWSSSEFDDGTGNYAHCVNMQDGDLHGFCKYDLWKVRPARAF
jgi:hypothetical protein